MEQACQHGRADAAAALLSAGLPLSSAEAQRLLLAAVERRDGALMAALLDGGGKSAFVPVQQSPARWPAPNPTMKGTGAATVGYKGIQTDYLPSSTVPLKTVEGIPGCKEGVNYAGGPH